MRYRPGRLLLVLTAVAIGLGMGCLLWPALEWAIGALALAAIVPLAQDVLALRAGLARIAATHELPAVAGRGLDFKVRLTVHNGNGRRWTGEVREVVPAAAEPAVWIEPIVLEPDQTAGVERTFRIGVRGRHGFGPVWVRLRGPCGMVEAQRRIELAGEIKIMPEGLVSREALAQNTASERVMLDKLTRSRLRGEGTEFESLDEFRQGDEPRRIDWRATARHRRLIMRRYQLEQHRDVMVVLDCGRLMAADVGGASKLDCAVDAALMLCRVALAKGDRCGLGLYDDRVIGYLPPVTGPRAWPILTESLFDVQPRWRESSFGTIFAELQTRQRKRALVIVIGDMLDTETTARMRAALAAMAQRHVVLFVALRTPLLGRLLRAPVATDMDIAQGAVAGRLLREREKTLHTLNRGGIHVLDIEPSKLTVPLINRYVELRERNLV